MQAEQIRQSSTLISDCQNQIQAFMEKGQEQFTGAEYFGVLLLLPAPAPLFLCRGV